MIARSSDSLLFQPSDICPSQDAFEVIGVFNPAVTVVRDTRIMLARVAERHCEKRIGWSGLPRWTDDQQMAVDWFREEDVHRADARVVSLQSSGDLRLTSVSHLKVFRQSSGDAPWTKIGVVLPNGPTEEFGIEDPRVTQIDDTYWITYVAVSRSGVATALMSTMDFVTFKRHGIIFPPENKDVVLFPQRISGDFVALHRPNPRSHFSPPQIWIARSPDLLHWGHHEPILRGIHSWEGDRVGSGTPPILIDQGWLTLYHGSERSNTPGKVGCYTAGALLLDREDPRRVIARSNKPILVPTNDYEVNGFVPNVVFPTAMLEHGEDWQVFYGAADTSVAMTQFSKRSVSDSLVSTRNFQL
jgi:predicted GH43/DUF377 family glycosyl hydrolase